MRKRMLIESGILAVVMAFTAACSLGPRAMTADFSYETQAMEITSADNARGLDGYACDDGRKIKEGALFRSGVLSWLNDEDARALSERYKIRYIVDFRSEAERAESPDVEISGAQTFNFPVFGADLYSEETKSKLGYLETLSGEEEYLAFVENGIVTERYERILFSECAQKAYARFFDVLMDAEEGEAVLWHCSGGKDRAGMASALLLYALGADDDTVMRDYLISNEAYAERVEKLRAQAEKNGLYGDEAAEFVTAGGGVDERFLKLAVDSVKERYGSMENYLNDALGVSDDDMEKLRDKFLEN